MRIVQTIKNSQKPRFSIEITPPLKTKSISKIFATIDKIVDFNPIFVAVTYHQQALQSGEKDLHLFQRHASSVGVAAAIKFKYGFEVLPHFICGGFDKFETDDAIFDLWFLGIDNILALRGDARKGETKFTPKPGGNKNAAELVSQIVKMGKLDFTHTLKPKEPMRFCIGVAGYPEVHTEAKSMEQDIKWLKHKVDCGAEFIITQMFFDFETFKNWEARCRGAGVNVPIIPGLKPVTQKKHIRRLSQNFGVRFPEDFVKKMESCKTSKEAYECGIDQCVGLSKKLIEYGCPIVHYFSMGSGADIADVAKNVFTPEDFYKKTK